MATPKVSYVKATELVSKDDVNTRFANNYNLDLMWDQIVAEGKIRDPLDVEKNGKGYVVLRGNRRTRAAQMKYNDTSISVELKKALDNIPVRIHENLTTIERIKLINDHGREKPLANSEIIQSVWRMFGNGMAEKEIILHFYEALADLTGNKTNRAKANMMPSGPEKEKYLHSWLHGTMNQKILAVFRMTPYIRNQYLLTQKKADGILSEDDKKNLEVELSSTRVAALVKAKSSDEANKDWNSNNGGTQFQTIVEQFKAEDAGTKPKKANSVPTKGQLKSMAEVYLDPCSRALLSMVSGNPVTEDILGLDAENSRNRKVMTILQNQTESKHKELFQAIVTLSPDKLQDYLVSVTK